MGLVGVTATRCGRDIAVEAFQQLRGKEQRQLDEWCEEERRERGGWRRQAMVEWEGGMEG